MCTSLEMSLLTWTYCFCKAHVINICWFCFKWEPFMRGNLACVEFSVEGLRIHWALCAKENDVWKFRNVWKQACHNVSDFPVPLNFLRGQRLIDKPRPQDYNRRTWTMTLSNGRVMVCFDYVSSKIHSTQLSKHTLETKRRKAFRLICGEI